MEHKKIIAFVGMPGSGKSTCVNYLTDLSHPSVYFGGVVVNEAKKRYGPDVTQVHEQIVREDLRKKDGMAAIALRVIPEIDRLLNTHDRVIADGLYSWSEYKVLKDKYKESLIVIAVTAPRQLRHKRLAHRPVRPLTATEADTRDRAEIEHIEKGGPIANADYTLVNDKSQKALLKNLDDLLVKVGYLI